MKIKALTLSLCAALLLSSCGSWKNTGWGTGIGAAAGAAIGLGIGHLAGNKAVGTAIGATVGAGAGALIGRKMDKAAEAAKQVEGAQVELVDINGLPAVKVTFDSGILFDFNSSKLSADAQASLTKFSEVLKATPDADVAILGHTDNIGTEKANQSSLIVLLSTSQTITLEAFPTSLKRLLNEVSRSSVWSVVSSSINVLV